MDTTGRIVVLRTAATAVVNTTPSKSKKDETKVDGKGAVPEQVSTLNTPKSKLVEGLRRMFKDERK